MTKNEIKDLQQLIKNNACVIFKDDLKEGNILYVEEDFAFYIDYTDEVEREIDLNDYSSDHFSLILDK